MNRKWKLLYFAMIGFLGFMIARGEAVQEKICCLQKELLIKLYNIVTE